jgi:small subunit ribosomal protein S17
MADEPNIEETGVSDTTEPTAEEQAPEEVSDTSTPEAEETPVVEAEPTPEEVSDSSETVDDTPDAEAVSDTPAEETPAAEEVSDTPTPAAKPTKSLRHVPRSLRRTRSKVKREAPKKRKPITRTEKPATEPARRQERRGVVVSDKGDKTIVVKVDVIKSHPKYKKVVRRSVKFQAHDEQNTAGVGDTVRIVESRPLSKTKHWRLVEVVEKAR